jgi:hypothetical protein
MIDNLVHLFTSGAYLPFALLLIYGGLRLVKDDTHWLNQGRLAVIAAAVLAGLSTLVPILTTGQTPNLQAVAMAFGAAWALYISPHPTPTPEPTKPAAS